MTGNELIDRLSLRFKEPGYTIGNYITVPEWKELHRLALLGHAAETAPIVAWKADNGQWAATESNAKAYEKRMAVKMYPLIIRPFQDNHAT